MSSLKVLILAGGFGTRVRSMNPLPKALFPLDADGGSCFIDWVIGRVLLLRPDSVLVSCGYLADQVVAHVSNRYSECPIEFSIDQEMRGCFSAIQQVMRSEWRGLSNVLVVPCDHFFTFNLEEAVLFHCERGNEITLLAIDSGKAYCRQVKIEGRKVSLVGQYLFSAKVCGQMKTWMPVGGMTDTVFSLPFQKEVFVFGNEYVWEDLGTKERILQFQASHLMKDFQ